MEDASTQNFFDYLKQLAGLKDDTELAKKLGYSKQGISTARRRNKISMKMYAKASLAFGKSIEELQEGTKQTASPRSNTGIQTHTEIGRLLSQTESVSPLFGLLERLVEENTALHKEKEALLEERAKLKMQVSELRQKLEKLAPPNSEDGEQHTAQSA